MRCEDEDDDTRACIFISFSKCTRRRRKLCSLSTKKFAEQSSLLSPRPLFAGVVVDVIESAPKVIVIINHRLETSLPPPQLKQHHASSSNNHQRHRPHRRRTLARLRSEKFHHAPRTWRKNHARRERRDDAVQRYASRKCLREIYVRGVSRGLGEVMPRRRTSIDTRRVRRDRR